MSGIKSGYICVECGSDDVEIEVEYVHEVIINRRDAVCGDCGYIEDLKKS